MVTQRKTVASQNEATSEAKALQNGNAMAVTDPKISLRSRELMRRAMQNSDDLVIEFDYADSKGEQTHRVVSPIRFLGTDRMLGLCLSREEPRQFYLIRCQGVQLKRAEDYLMPVPMTSSR